MSVLGPEYRHLYLAPDGDLTRVPFELITDADGRYVWTNFTITYLASVQDLLSQSRPRSKTASAPVVLADPDFDLTSEGAQLPEERGMMLLRTDGQSRGWARESARFSALPASPLEGEQIAKLLRVEPKIGKEALESAVKAVRSPEILHIATHGFFFEDQSSGLSKENNARATETFDRLGPLSRLENPLLRSGLALAGANAWLDGRPTLPAAEDGILTAEDTPSAVSQADSTAISVPLRSNPHTSCPVKIPSSASGGIGPPRSHVFAPASASPDRGI
jgi:CHAT domain